MNDAHSRHLWRKGGRRKRGSGITKEDVLQKGLGGRERERGSRKKETEPPAPGTEEDIGCSQENETLYLCNTM